VGFLELKSSLFNFYNPIRLQAGVHSEAAAAIHASFHFRSHLARFGLVFHPVLAFWALDYEHVNRQILLFFYLVS